MTHRDLQRYFSRRYAERLAGDVRPDLGRYLPGRFATNGKVYRPLGWRTRLSGRPHQAR